MKIKTLLVLGTLLIANVVAYAGSCRNCGSDTDDCSVYRCNKCRTFFCARCREGDKVEASGHSYVDGLNAIIFEMNSTFNGIKIVCPECGESDTLVGERMQKGKIRKIK